MLFTDLVGSTALRSRLGEDAAEELRRKHDRLLADAIAAKRGRLVKNLGDGVMATFTGASDALSAAAGIQQAVDRHNRSTGSPASLEVRVGLSAGDVTFEDGDCFGTPVIEAARLCAAAGGGQILVSEVVRLLGGSGYRLVSLGQLELKGLPEPVSTWEVAWEPSPVSPVPLPALLAGGGRIFVGRDEDLERLSQLWKETAAGERRLALLAGEPGIGKTRLASELASTALDQGALVLAGRCDEDLGVPYQPFVEALRYYAAHAREPRLGRYGGELTRLVPELVDVVPGPAAPLRSDPETERYRLFDAVAAWLAEVSTETPVLLVLDDVHWAAKPTLLLLRHVLRFGEPLRLLVVVTYRDSEVGRGHPLSELLADLRRVEGVARFPLTGLDQAAVAAFIEAAAGHVLTEEVGALPRTVWAETEGNPFFVAEVLRLLVETGGIEYREGRWFINGPVEELGIPEGVRDVVGRRLSRLSESADRALAVASVVGLEFEEAVVRTAGDLTEDTLLSALEEAASARLLMEVAGARYRFSHALVRATLYDELTGARRVALHRRVAQAIEVLHANALDDHLSALAHHWARAAAPAAETARAVEYATRAGDRALSQLANDEAVSYYRQALELLRVGEAPVDEAQRIELLIALGEAERRGGDPSHRSTLLEAAHAARARGDADALARAALANTRGAMYAPPGEPDRERMAVLEQALEGTGTADSPLRARLLATLGLELTWGERERRVGLSDEALVVARRLGDPPTLADVLLARYYAITSPETHRERMANTDELLALAVHLGDPAIHSRALALRFRVVIEEGDVEEADRCLKANERLTDSLHQPTLRWFVALQRAGRTLLAGGIDEGERLVFEAFRIGEASGQPDASLLFLWQLFSVRLEQDRLGELVEDLRREVEEIPKLVGTRGLLALAHAELNQADEAREALRPVSASGFARLARDTIWLRAVTESAAACARIGEAGWAADLHGLLSPYGDLFPTACLGTATGSVAYYLGLLASTLERFDEAEERFSAAEVIHVRIGAPTWLARTRLEWARMLLARRQPGDDERARDLLGQALATARELGLANVERRAVELLT
jgi:class 3 adenylate cyclase/tetratricopeptide (TPR) repeat protein